MLIGADGCGFDMMGGYTSLLQVDGVGLPKVNVPFLFRPTGYPAHVKTCLLKGFIDLVAHLESTGTNAWTNHHPHVRWV